MCEFRDVFVAKQNRYLTNMTVSSSSYVPITPRAGLVTVFTGDGKGKTTAAVGTAVRATGYGLKTCVIFFLKGKMFDQGEVKSLASLNGVDTYSFGVDDWVKKGENNPAAIEQARKALATAAKMIECECYDLVILDEINSAVDFGLIDAQNVLDILRMRPSKVDVILTGRNADKRIMEVADIITEMKCIKHAFERGIKARQGIDY